MRAIRAWLPALVLLAAAPAWAQPGVDGYVSILADAFPALPRPGGDTERSLELRARLFIERRFERGEHLRLQAAGFADALVANRSCPPPDRACGTVSDIAVSPQDLYVEIAWDRADIRAGYSRVVWGRLDELQPTDVVNPIDVSRFLFEGRAEARLAVPLVRARLFLPRGATLEGIVVPVFRRGRFDQLDEASSPFNLLRPIACAGPACALLPVTREEPATAWRHVQGGGRLTATAGRVDWSVSAWRGLEPLPLLRAGAAGSAEAPLALVYPRFTMVGADFETVHGPWGLRGEVAVLPDDAFQGSAARILPGRSVEAGVGIDRRAGDYRVSGSVLARRRTLDAGYGGESFDRTDVNVIGSIDRTFARETRRAQVFAVLDPSENTAFLRAIVTLSLRDNLSLDVSGGAFLGNGPDTLGAFTDRDFLSMRLKRFF